MDTDSKTEQVTVATAAAPPQSNNVELSTLKEERDVIRTRVTEMLEQLEGLNL